MAFNSFYGGRQGTPFIIVKSYNTIQEMINNFKQGLSYSTVNFDEYVVIDTADKTNEDNGKIYRRGRDYNNELGGAIYIGQVAGAPGPASQLELTTIQDIEATAADKKGTGSYTLEDSNLIPGKYIKEDGTVGYNDEIKWAYCSIIDANGKKGIAKIGFVIPYLVVDYDAELVAGDYSGKFFERTDDKTHPFYQKWHLSIPKGEKGTSISNIEIDTGEREGEGTQKVQVTYNDNTPTETIGKPLNYIMKTAITTDYHLVILNSDPQKRQELITAGKNYSWESRNDWQDLGSIKDENGIWIGMNYDTTEYPELIVVTTAISFLNEHHPNGLTGDLKGKVITIGAAQTDKSIYAFDYNTKTDGSYKGWYFLGTVDGTGAGSTTTVVGKETDETTQILANALPVNGVWFIVE